MTKYFEVKRCHLARARIKQPLKQPKIVYSKLYISTSLKIEAIKSGCTGNPRKTFTGAPSRRSNDCCYPSSIPNNKLRECRTKILKIVVIVYTRETHSSVPRNVHRYVSKKRRILIIFLGTIWLYSNFSLSQLSLCEVMF